MLALRAIAPQGHQGKCFQMRSDPPPTPCCKMLVSGVELLTGGEMTSFSLPNEMLTLVLMKDGGHHGSGNQGRS